MTKMTYDTNNWRNVWGMELTAPCKPIQNDERWKTRHERKRKQNNESRQKTCLWTSAKTTLDGMMLKEEQVVVKQQYGTKMHQSTHLVQGSLHVICLALSPCVTDETRKKQSIENWHMFHVCNDNAEDDQVERGASCYINRITEQETRKEPATNTNLSKQHTPMRWNKTMGRLRKSYMDSR